jgi:DNA end-binding protein Ku
MAARSMWKGFLKLSLVSVPVKAYNATTSGSVRLNQLHGECKSRIRHIKKCPIHGEVANDELVSGFEYSKDQYVVVDTDELDKLRTEDDKAIKIDAFISPEALDPLYLTGRSYFLVPEGPVGQHAFAVIYQAMADSKRCAIATVVMQGKEQLVLLRPLQGLLVMTTLHYQSEVSSPAAFEEEVPKVSVAADELKLAKALVQASATDKPDLGKYRDLYTEKLTQLIDAKVSGKELVSPPPSDHVEVINLMDALKKSVEKTKKPGAPAAAEKPARKMAPSKTKADEPKRKRKSS